VVVRGCFDPNPTAARTVAAYLGAPTHGPEPRVSESTEVDGVLVATPPEQHYSVAAEYLRAGKAVLLEKPAVVSAEQMAALTELSVRHGRPVLVNHFRRFFPGIRAARDLVASGLLGQVLQVHAWEGTRWEWPVVSRYIISSPYGGVIYDTGSHLLDSVLFMLSLDTSREGVDYAVDQAVKKPSYEPSHDVSVRLSLGRAGICTRMRITRTEALARHVTVVGDRGALRVPVSPDGAAIVVSAQSDLLVQSPSGERASVETCCRRTHLEFIERLTGMRERSDIDLDRFAGLIPLLEDLSSGTRQ
jgi:predicted dehydrogenase